ncbi:MAG: DNA polymerase III subunit gamma/tau [Prevotella sp.]|nr:DNA polymerase III subunit gamma/tau [Prevotella sp.]
MEEYIVSARKYRPMTFDSVVGQRTLTTTLKNAVNSGKLAHAYLFCGPRGVGKTTCARIFAKAINCLAPTAEGEACNQCESCQAFNEQRSYNIFELDAASNNSVENIKSLMEQTRIPPQVGKYKVFIIDEVHMLSTQAFNAFLKTLEEPPAHVIFILATTEKHKILPTIISRCQIYDFERMSVEDTIQHLKEVAQKEGIEVEDEALAVIAEKADGGMRDALSIFDQTASFCQGKITYQKVIEDLNVLDADNYFRIIDLALENKVPDIMLLLNQIISRGFDGGNLINGLAAHVRNVLMAKDAQTLPLLEVSQQQRERYQQQAQKTPTPFLYRALQVMNQCDQGYRQSSNKRLLVELTLIQVAQITQPDDAESAGRGPKRLKSLFQKLLDSNRQQKVASQGGTAGRKTHKTVAAEPVETAKKEPAPKFKINDFGPTFKSLSKGKEKFQQEEIEAENKGENSRFTQEQLQQEWLAMCNRMPKEMIAMAQRMKNMTPQLLTPDSDAPQIEIVVDNNILLDQINTIQKRIKLTLAKALHNGNIDLRIRLSETSEIKPILTKRQIFDLIRKENPAIEKLRTSLELHLS